jgi:hypothetical protein
MDKNGERTSKSRIPAEEGNMKFEPGKFYIGVVDFFSIMLPGGIFAYFLYGLFGSKVFGPLLPVIKSDADGWVIFLLAAYLFGHIVFLVGSLLDDIAYDPIRKTVWAKKKDRAYPEAQALKLKYVGDKKDAEVVNTFQWAKAVLVLQHPAGIVEVARHEADSKFFRSLVVVLAFLSYGAFLQAQPMLGWLFILLLAASFWRYVERRYKSTQQAYCYVITLNGLEKLK